MITIDVKEFLDLLGTYNTDIWPMQIFIALFGLLAIYFIFRPSAHSHRIITFFMALCWLWVGIVFCFKYWTQILGLAYVFGGICAITGLLLLYAAFRNRLIFRYSKDWRSVAGLFFILYGVIGYQALGYIFDHTYPQLFAFGLVPCPTAIYTIGLFMLADRKIPVLYLLGPIILSTAGFKVVPLGVYEDIILIVAGIFAVFIIFKPSTYENQVKKK